MEHTNANPTDATWLNGPAAIGEREFVMPMPDGTAWVYTPQEMSSLTQLDYTYDSLPPIPRRFQLPRSWRNGSHGWERRPPQHK